MSKKTAKTPKIRKGQGSVQLTRENFQNRMKERFYNPAFGELSGPLQQIINVAWETYKNYEKSPRTVRAGLGFADPNFQLPKEWVETRRKIRQAQIRQAKPSAPRRVLLICGAARSDKTCPGEMSKTFRLVRIARSTLLSKGIDVDLLDLSHLTSEYGRIIYPCKACVSTAMPLCHWPCSCYPNHAVGQVNDWMADIYPKWVAAHGVMIITPVYWYQAPSVLKLMMDRLVCADGGNSDPTTTQGKNPAMAKDLELKGWPYPKHLAGRAFSVVVHGDAAGVDTLRDMICNWLTDMELVPAGQSSKVGQYIGYYEPYATSHDALDKDWPIQEEVRNAARSLASTLRMMKKGTYRKPDAQLHDPQPK